MFEKITDELPEILKPWTPYLLLVLTIFIIFQKYGGSHIQPWFMSTIYIPWTSIHHDSVKEFQRKHFEKIKNHKSADPELRKKGILRILEIGPGPGYNFEFYPSKSQLSVVEVNPFFEKQFFEKQADHPHIKMDRFIVGFAENMKDVPDNSVDIVVSSFVLCSVRSVEGALKEVHRVLVPGGKYYYFEHIRDYKYAWVRFLQHLYTYTFYDLLFGCNLNRVTNQIIEANKWRFSKIDQKLITTPMKKRYYPFYICVTPVVVGIAEK